MYGLLELAEQIRNGGATGSWSRIAATLHSTDQHPAIEFRADNPFIHATDKSLQFDVPMWEAYIDQLARNRYNWLDLHGAHNLTSTQYPNIYPLLVHVPEYPTVGNQAEQERNLKDFETICAYARSRAIHVGLMDYSAEGLAPRGSQTEDYMAHAICVLLKAVPDLTMLGFRIGESGKHGDFLERAYFRGLAMSGRRDIRLYTRTWLTPESDILEIGKAAQGNVDIEIKYNGEQLGQPYQAIGKGGGSYSFQGYIRPNAPYRIIWQVRANGTHCFWAWADSRFIRRAVKTFTLGNARGFTLEPHIAYFDYMAATYYRSPEDAAVYRYIWQKHWMWYFLWGRLAYNPELPEETLVAGFRQHFGEPGPAIYQAFQSAGPIVPLVCSWRYQGPDQRMWSPETETGCFVNNDRKWWYQDLKERAAQIGLAPPHPLDVTDFALPSPMDNAAFSSIKGFLFDKLHKVPDGRVSPPAVSLVLMAAAKATREAVARVGDPPGRAGDEWRLLKTDLLSASYLGDFYANRIMGVTQLWYALWTGSSPDYRNAVAYLAASRASWRNLSATADAVFAPLNNGMRHEPSFQWSLPIPMLEQLDKTAPRVWSRVPHDSAAHPLVFTPADVGQDFGVGVDELNDSYAAGIGFIECRVNGAVAQVRLHYRSLPSESDWHDPPLTMTRVDNTSFTAQIPVGPEGAIYFVELVAANGEARDFPNPLLTRPYQIIEPWDTAGG